MIWRRERDGLRAFLALALRALRVHNGFLPLCRTLLSGSHPPFSQISIRPKGPMKIWRRERDGLRAFLALALRALRVHNGFLPLCRTLLSGSHPPFSQISIRPKGPMKIWRRERDGLRAFLALALRALRVHNGFLPLCRTLLSGSHPPFSQISIRPKGPMKIWRRERDGLRAFLALALRALRVHNGFLPLCRTLLSGSHPPFSQISIRPKGPMKIWRRERDSNPRYVKHAHTLSRRAPSTARAPLQHTSSSRGLRSNAAGSILDVRGV